MSALFRIRFSYEPVIQFLAKRLVTAVQTRRVTPLLLTDIRRTTNQTVAKISEIISTISK